MKLFEGKEVKLYDIETFKHGYFYLDIDVNTGEYSSFEISREKNELYSFVKYLDGKIDWMIGFNNINFDMQVVQYILDRVDSWSLLSGEEINNNIYIFSQRVIDDTNHGVFPPYREEQFLISQIDLFRIHHFDNDSRRTSLKWLQYMMNWHNLETIPHNHAAKLTKEEWEEVKSYCKNDIDSTLQFYKYTIGEVEHEMYRGKNKIQDRIDLINEGLLPPIAISFSDSKIGDELNKRAYCKITGKSLQDLYTLKKNRKPTKKFTFNDAIPKYVHFSTPELQEFHRRVGKERVSLKQGEEQEFTLQFRNTTYTIARGGIHSTESHRIIMPKEDEILRDADVGSQYPNAIRKRELFPSHLGIAWNQVGVNNINTRLGYKAKSSIGSEEEKRKYKGLSEMYKLALNSGYFGKTIETTNWQYGPEVGYYCTIGNQFEILMLIEMLELEGIHCISGNTDGIVCLFKKDLEERYYEACHKWEKIVGNDVLGQLEYTDFKGLYQESINHYIAVKVDGKVKIKGRFTTEDEIHKNNSDKISRIERKALVNYFSKGIPVEDTIYNSDNIWDFCIGKKASKDYYWQTIGNSINNYDKLIRFYISYSENKLLKRKKETSEAPGAEITKYFDGYSISIFNKYTPLPIKEYGINYEYYINNIKQVVGKIEKKRKNKNFIESPKEQLNLF
jgi:hypothetical protein